MSNGKNNAFDAEDAEIVAKLLNCSPEEAAALVHEMITGALPDWMVAEAARLLGIDFHEVAANAAKLSREQAAKAERNEVPIQAPPVLSIRERNESLRPIFAAKGRRLLKPVAARWPRIHALLQGDRLDPARASKILNDARCKDPQARQQIASAFRHRPRIDEDE
jgi:hypothetical protein